MGCSSNTIQVQCLGEDVAWDLFRYNVGDEIIDANSEIEVLAKKMVAECRGFPSALCTVGRSMSIKRDMKEWRIAYDMLKSKCSPPSEFQEMDDEVILVCSFLKMNYRTLSPQDGC